MRICIIGSGATGLILSILLKQQNKDNDVFVIEKNAKIAKKLYATGNGKCNIGNSSDITKGIYYNDDKVLSILNNFTFEKQIKYFKSIGLYTKMNNELCYPYSESAKSFIDTLIDFAKQNGVHFILETQFVDYKINNNIVNVKCIPEIKNNTFDKLVITSGGCSSPVLGSDGSVFEILKKHGYQITNLIPGLAPIYTKENTKSVSGNRVKANVSLLVNGNKVYSEKGEVLFKDKGLSGIVIMNISSFIARRFINTNNEKYILSLDLLSDISYNDFEEIIKFNKLNNRNILSGIFNDQLSLYFDKMLSLSKSLDVINIYEKLKNVCFNFDGFYPFKDSQVTVGGVKNECFDLKTLSSRHEPNIYFGGEVLNFDGLCGGFNLMYCFACAKTIANDLK